MNNVADFWEHKEANALKIMRRRMADSEGLSDHSITGGTWIDATSAGMKPHEVAVLFFMSQDPLDFEARVLVEMEKQGLISINWREDEAAKEFRALVQIDDDPTTQ